MVIDIFVNWRDFAGLEYIVKYLENVADLKSVVVYSGYTEVWSECDYNEADALAE